MKKLKSIIMIMSLLTPLLVQAQTDTLYVYGPGGPFGPINECGKIFSLQHQLMVKVVAGPESNWINEANKNADLVFGGAEYMLTQFSMKHPGLINNESRQELYKRGAAILVRPGNPKKIHSLKDLTKTGISILDVNGAGQFGLWEDLAGKENLIAGIQKNIKQSFENTALGIAGWKKDISFDAWISYSSWHYRLTDITALVELPKVANVYRGTPIALSTISTHPKEATQFIQFMQSEKGHEIFKKWGWE
nr:substrate-binding domain-containing protein [uncultured Pedobacter sp.]